MGIAECFASAAASYDQHAQLQRRIGQRLLAAAKPAPLWLDLGAGTGFISAQLPAKQVIALDLALPMLMQGRISGRFEQALCADIGALPLRDDCIDAMAANLSMQWCPDLTQALVELGRVIRADGQLLFTLPIAGCFIELDALVAQRTLGCNRCPEVGQIEQALAHSGWCGKLQEVTERMYFDSAKALLRHFKATGAHYHREHQGGLKGRRWWRQVEAELERFRQPEGIPLTWKLLLVEAVRA
ncbi:methyltransferase domain-containing protein [Ferrimonas pelagia]|uniref:Malonyl-ACP O-methyltransferase BioC n=1 Tax=Ferrimonas pelagia TaxID=1177826 RepID=A0ABP9EJG0_9GAMM